MTLSGNNTSPTRSHEAETNSRDGEAPKVCTKGISKWFLLGRRAVHVLADVDLSFYPGEFVSIVGPSGCGKTTLLRIVAGLEEQSEGSVEIWHDDPARPQNSMVFQEMAVFPWMTVRDNISYGLRMRHVPKSEWKPIVGSYLETVGLTSFADAYPHQLSGGMKQRVSVARAFANNPEILLMDEPFAALDEQNKILMQEELLRIWDLHRKTVLFITHSIDEALFLSDRVIVMSASPGRIKAEISVPFSRPRDFEHLKGLPEFGALGAQIWHVLREEVLRAKADSQADQPVS